MKDTITKGELKFWLSLFTIVITVVIWGAKLEEKVSAMEMKDISLGQQIGLVVERQIKIMVRLGIEP